MSGASSRRKGAEAERAVVKYLRANGFPYADRRGAGFDGADIVGMPGITVEIKAQAGARLATWVDQAQEARAKAGDTYGVLIAKRAGTTDVGRWHAVLPMAQFMALLAEAGWTAPDPTP